MEASTLMVPEARGTARSACGLLGSPAVLWVGRLNADKDPLTVLAGFERALDGLPAATLTMIYSEEDQLAAVRERVERCRPSPATSLIGRVSARSDVVVL